MKIEYLFEEYSCLYGDQANVTYLEKNLPKGSIFHTSFNDKPKFLTNKIDLIYMGSLSEINQEKIIKKLLPFKKKIKELISNNTIFLFTGNSFEIFGKYIIKENREKIKGLGLIDFYSVRTIPTRYNSLYLGKFNDLNIVGYTSRFSFAYSDNNYLFQNTKGYGMNLKCKYEGIRYKNFFGTYLLGPILILNPYFTKYLLSLKGFNKPLLYEEDLIKAYDYRVYELETRNDMNH